MKIIINCEKMCQKKIMFFFFTSSKRLLGELEHLHNFFDIKWRLNNIFDLFRLVSEPIGNGDQSVDKVVRILQQAQEEIYATKYVLIYY